LLLAAQFGPQFIITSISTLVGRAMSLESADEDDDALHMDDDNDVLDMGDVSMGDIIVLTDGEGILRMSSSTNSVAVCGGGINGVGALTTGSLNTGVASLDVDSSITLAATAHGGGPRSVGDIILSACDDVGG
jgi:hypothetical protein